MKTTPLRIAALASIVCLLALPAAADETPGEAAKSLEARLIASKAGAVVALKFVLKIEMSFGGQTREQENNGTATGVVVDDSGLVMTAAGNFDPALRFGRRMRQQIEVDARPVNLRVIFPGEEKEHPAILGAKDSKLGLAFVLIKDLGEKKPVTLDLERTAEPKVGDVLYGVTRLDQGFDHAPICSRVRVIGAVTKPRRMWTLSGAGSFVSEPLYTAEGAVTGVCVRQEGVGQNTQQRLFVLPLGMATATVGMAKRESQRALDEILEAEEEAAAEAAKEAAESGGEGEGGGKEAGKDDEKPAGGSDPDEPGKGG